MDSRRSPLISAEISVSGQSFDPSVCTTAVGITPTRVWRQTREWLLDRPDLPNVSWLVSVEKVASYSTDETARMVLDIVWPRRKQLKRFVADHDVHLELTCSVTIHEDRPLYELSVGTMKRLVFLGADFGLDIFDYSTDDENGDSAP